MGKWRADIAALSHRNHLTVGCDEQAGAVSRSMELTTELGAPYLCSDKRRLPMVFRDPTSQGFAMSISSLPRGYGIGCCINLVDHLPVLRESQRIHDAHQPHGYPTHVRMSAPSLGQEGGTLAGNVRLS